MPRATPIYKLREAFAPEELQALLSEFYLCCSLKVTRVSVKSAPAPTKNQRAARRMYKGAFAKNESNVHSHLKWCGLHWCVGTSHSELQKYRYEVRIAYPNQLELALSRPGKREVVGEGVVLPPRHRFFMDGCVEKVADVFGSKQIVECGATDPSSLVLPLAARVASRVLWLPYPRGSARADWNYLSASCEGLLIEHRSAAATPAQHFDHYPLRVLKKGRFTVLLGNRDSQAQLLPHGGVQISYHASAS